MDFFIEKIAENWEIFISLFEGLKREKLALKKERLPSGDLVTKGDVQSLFHLLSAKMSEFLQIEVTLPKVVFHAYLGIQRRKSRLIFFALLFTLLGISGMGFYLTKIGKVSYTEAYYMAIPFIFIIMFPFSLYRRLKTYLEHGSFYFEDDGEMERIVIFDLPLGRFLCYGLHELAFHVLALHHVRKDVLREGWARGVQLRLSRSLVSQGVDTLSPALELTLGRLRCAAEVISQRRDVRLPLWIKRVNAPFHSHFPLNMLYSYRRDWSEDIKGESLSTAYFLILENLCGEGVYKEFLEKRVDERWPSIPI